MSTSTSGGNTSGGNTSGEQKEDLTEQGNLMEQRTLIKKQTSLTDEELRNYYHR